MLGRKILTPTMKWKAPVKDTTGLSIAFYRKADASDMGFFMNKSP